MIATLLLLASFQIAQQPTAITISTGEMTFEALAAGPEGGEPVMLLHGFPQTAHSFREIVSNLGGAGFRAVAPTQRGYSPGARPEEVSAYSMTELVGDVFRMADALGWQRFHLVGHDWGGAVAWVSAGAVPDRLASLTVLSTPHPAALAEGRRSAGSAQASASAYFTDFAAEGAAERLLSNNRAGLRQILSGINTADQFVYLEALGTVPALTAALAWYRAAFGRTPNSSAAPNRAAPAVTVPTLYIWGELDSAFASETASKTGEWVSAEYRFVPVAGIGHWLPERAAELVTLELMRHLKANSVAEAK